MEKIILSDEFQIIKILKKSTAKMFDKLCEGDVIKISVEVFHLGTSRGRSYAPFVDIENLMTGEKTSKTFNQLDSILSRFELN